MRDHGRPAGRTPETNDLTSQARAPSHAERCRTLAARTRSATLSTLAKDPAGFPYGSLVTVAFDALGRPLLFLSELAEHTQNLKAHAEASVLLTEPLDTHPEPLAASRVTLLGPCQPLAESERHAARERFLSTHPSARTYIDFSDFCFYRLEPVALRYVGGFGRMSWVTAADYQSAEADPLANAAAGILAHMNDDHADAVVAYAQGIARVADVESAKMTAVDRYGFDVAVATKSGPRAIRLAFDEPVSTTDEVRRAMVALVKKARASST
jgi:heme iron utilization protein